MNEAGQSATGGPRPGPQASAQANPAPGGGNGRPPGQGAGQAGEGYDRGRFDASRDPLVTVGPDGAITDVNTAAEQATGCRREELIGTEFSGYFTEPGRARAACQGAIRDGVIRDYPLQLRHRDGHTTPVLCNASVYRDQSGQVQGVFAAARDVTQIRKTQAALRDSGERLRAIFDAAPVGMYELAPGGEVLRANARFCQLTGYTADELRSLRIQDLVHPDDREADADRTRRLLSGEAASYTLEKRYLRKDGGVVWAEVNRALVRQPDGSPLLVAGVIRDLTAQREAEAAVRALTDQLEQRVRQRTAQLAEANRNLEQFTYSVSHDLRAPLRALNGFTAALLEEAGDVLTGNGRRYADRIMAASAQLARLIDDLLRLSRLSRAAMRLEPVDLSAEAAAIIAELRSGEPGRQVSCAVQEGIRANADRNLIRIVLRNLLENAWKFTARREDARIEFGTTSSGTEVCYYIRDNGAGFDPAYAAKLFQPFERLHPASQFPGTGVGLASVRRIIERHGGLVWAEGIPGHGATFFFTLGGGRAG